MGKCNDCYVDAGFLNDLCAACANYREALRIKADEKKRKHYALNKQMNMMDKAINATIAEPICTKNTSAKEGEQSELLAQANQTIRKANLRVKELKGKVAELNKRVILANYQQERLQQENRLLSQKLALNDSPLKGLFAYEILGFEEKPKADELRKKYKKLSLIYHPDRGGCRKMMNIITQANLKMKD